MSIKNTYDFYIVPYPS